MKKTAATESDIQTDIDNFFIVLADKYHVESGDVSPTDLNTLRIIIENYLINNQVGDDHGRPNILLSSDRRRTHRFPLRSRRPI